MNELTSARAREFLNLRALLEMFMLTRAIPKLGSAEIELLKELCREMDASIDQRAWLAKNREFHQALCAPAETTFMLGLLEQLSRRVGRYQHRWNDTAFERNKREASIEHWAIVDALDSEEHDRARRELERHITHIRARVVEEFAKHEYS